MTSAINFKPAPKNDFEHFIETYYTKCQQRIPEIQAIAGKWNLEDLIPGLSDFDSRFIYENSMTAEKWCKTSEAIGQVHHELCRTHPEWDRILEHTPGINLTWDELTGSATYYPEYKQWTFYHTSEPALLEQTKTILANRPWDSTDEYFHLKKFLLYFTPYDRKIDPAINIGSYGRKYLLHSRIMHYFLPPLQSAISILRKEALAGKMQALRLGYEMFPEAAIIHEALDIVEKHYEIPRLYDEPNLSQFEARLFDALKLVAAKLADSVKILPNAASRTIQDWKSDIKKIAMDPTLTIFDNAKFSRTMLGRLQFYASAPAHFDSILLIRNELKRLGSWFFQTPFRTYAEVICGENLDDPAEIVPQLVPDFLTEQEMKCSLAFNRLTLGPHKLGDEIETAKQIADVYKDFFCALYKIIKAVMQSSRKPNDFS